MKYFIVFVLAIFSLINPLHTSSTYPIVCFNQGATYAVIVGIADYQYGQFNQGDLQYASKDAYQFYTFFTDNNNIKEIPKENIILLIDDYATKENILLTAKSVFAKAMPNDRIIFYFSGHGRPNYLVPFNANMAVESHLSFLELKSAFQSSRATTKLCIIDACHANSVKTAIKKSKPSRVSTPTDSNNQIAIMVSAQAFQSSFEHSALRQGIFSHFLLKGLNGAADKNRDKTINVKELHQYVYTKVRAFTSDTQVPHTFGYFPMDMPIVTFVN